ncbi:MAG: 3-hydroxyacyl-CoA dehydrogenase [Alphaproteobacteria bacterium]|nr:3-hydroxyacyl-CoA dehydrogenase [Alphaproteobacteria bacterium]
MALNQMTVVAVIGAGAMGAGIAEVAARARHHVLLFDTVVGVAEKARAGIADRFRRAIQKGNMTEQEAASIITRIEPVAALNGVARAGLVIEAIVEAVEPKHVLFKALEGLVGEEAVLATNTSSLSVTQLGSVLTKPQRFLGLHFFNPAPIMALVEVISGIQTPKALADEATGLMRAWGKEPVQCRSTPGFIVNRIARPYYGEAVRLLEEGVATPATIDALMMEAGGFRIGPFGLMDLVGLDVNLAANTGVWQGLGQDPRYAPTVIQREMAASGNLGRKTGRGYYDYEEGAKRPEPATAAPAARPAKVALRGEAGVTAPLIARARDAGVTIDTLAGPPALVIDGHALALSDGRPAALRYAADLGRPAVLFDHARNFATATRIAIAPAPQAEPAALGAAIGFFQALGIAVSVVGDSAGLVVLRTLAMAANEGVVALEAGVCGPSDVDLAMEKGTNWPEGPLAWGVRVGLDVVLEAMEHMAATTGSDRYRPSMLLRRAAVQGVGLDRALVRFA